MSESEKRIIEKICDSVSKATDEKKAYMLGVMEGMALVSSGRKEEKPEEEQ